MRWLRLMLFAISAPWMAAATFVWNGGAGDGVYANASNWAGGVAPPNDGSAVLVFGNSGSGIVKLSGFLNVAQIRFENSSTHSYLFSSPSNAVVTLRDGMVSSHQGGSGTFSSDILFNLPTAQSFSLGSGTLSIDGSILGLGSINKTGSGNLKLVGLNLWTGGLTHSAGTLTLGGLANLGLGPLTLSGGELSLPMQGDVVIANPVVIQSSTRISGVQDQFAVFAGTVTLAANATIDARGASGIYLTGALQESGGPRQLAVTGITPVIISGASGYTGGTTVENGSLIFASPGSVPSTGVIRSSPLGYVGIAFTESVDSTILSRLDPAGFRGMIGFDTAPWQGTTNVFSRTIDLTGLPNYASVGSHTSAVLGGEVKVNKGEAYRFGGGGGTLYLESNLTARGGNLDVISPFGQPLKLVLRGVNTFSGSANVLYSVLVLDRSGTIQSSTALNLTGPGYVGYTENAGFTPAAFLSRLSRISSRDAIVGIDSANPQAPRTVTEAIDLSVGGKRTDPYYLGTSSQVTLTGTLTPTVGDALYLTAVKGGRLIVRSSLNNIPSLVVGQSGSFDPQGGTVEIANANTFGGGTEVRGGTLQMSHSRALGSGAVSVSDRATLYVSSGVTLSNPLSLASGGRLSGTGMIASGLTVSHGAILSPGGLHQVGSLSFGSLNLGPGGTLELDLIGGVGGSAFGIDRLLVGSGALTVSANGGSPFTVSLSSLDPTGTPGLLSGFDPSQTYSWEFASASNVLGFTSSAFTVNSAQFLNSTGGGSFFVSQNGNTLVVNFTPVPEPETVVLLAIGLVAIAALELRRRNRR